MNYNSSAIATQAGKQAYEGVKVSAKPGTSLAGFRKSAQVVRLTLLKRKEEVDKQCQEISSTYATAVADPKVAELRAKYKDDIAENQRRLFDNLTEIVSGKRKAVERFTVIPPSEEVSRLINAYSLRNKDTVSDTEWSYLVSAVGNNYLALRMVESISTRLDRTFSMPFTPDDTLKDLDTLENIASLAINSIAVPDDEIASTSVIRFFNYDGQDGRVYDPYIGNLVESLDSSAGAVIPEEYRSIGKRLADAKEKAYDNDNVTLSVKIGSFMRKYADQIQTPEELKEQIYEQAEELIAQANKPV